MSELNSRASDVAQRLASTKLFPISRAPGFALRSKPSEVLFMSDTEEVKTIVNRAELANLFKSRFQPSTLGSAKVVPLLSAAAGAASGSFTHQKFLTGAFCTKSRLDSRRDSAHQHGANLMTALRPVEKRKARLRCPAFEKSGQGERGRNHFPFRGINDHQTNTRAGSDAER